MGNRKASQTSIVPVLKLNNAATGSNSYITSGNSSPKCASYSPDKSISDSDDKEIISENFKINDQM